jgi:hypothetical protein
LSQPKGFEGWFADEHPWTQPAETYSQRDMRAAYEAGRREALEEAAQFSECELDGCCCRDPQKFADSVRALSTKQEEPGR